MRRRLRIDRGAGSAARLEGSCSVSSRCSSGAYVLYQLVRGLVGGNGGYKPFGDATKIINLERTLHVFIEPSIQAWAPSSPLADGHRRLDVPERATTSSRSARSCSSTCAATTRSTSCATCS